MSNFNLNHIVKNKPEISLFLSFIPLALGVHFMPIAYDMTTMELFQFGAKLKGYNSRGTTSFVELFPVSFYFTLVLLLLGVFLKKRTRLLTNISAFGTLCILYYNLWTSDLLFSFGGFIIAIFGVYYVIILGIVYSNNHTSESDS